MQPDDAERFRADERPDVLVTLDDGDEAEGELRAWKRAPRRLGRVRAVRGDVTASTQQLRERAQRRAHDAVAEARPLA